MTSSFFNGLPEELLDRIISLVDQPSALYALALVSKDINRITTPHLYTCIALGPTSFQHLRPLAFLLFTSPKHHCLVRSISVKRAYGGNLLPWPCNPDLDVVLMRQIELFVREDDVKRWFREVRDGSDPLPIASLLLRSLPKVVKMGFEGFDLVDPRGRTIVDG